VPEGAWGGIQRATVAAIVLGMTAGIGFVDRALAAAPVAGATAQEGEEDLFRKVKVAVFDQDWSAVLSGCEEILARFPASPAASQAAFNRARALSHLPGREAEAGAAYRRFVTRYPGDRLLVEESWSGIFTLACDPRRQSTSGCAATLLEGLDSPSVYVATLAAIRAGDTRDEAVRRRALPVLKRALDTQTDPDIRNEILIAILKIDPRQVPLPGPRASADLPVPAAGAPSPPSLIRMTVFNKAEKRYDLKVNLPVAFARMLVESLDEDDRAGLRAEAKKQGVDLDDIFEAIQKQGAGRFLDVDTPESRIEIWIE